MSARIEGLQQIQARLRKMSMGARTNVRAAVKRSAVRVEAAAKRSAPVDTGRMRSSITHEISGDGLGATIGTNVEYAPHVEFGTRFQRAQPFLFPAFEAEREPFRRAIEKALKDAAK